VPAEGPALAGIVAVVVLMFLPTLGFGFVYDDVWTIVDNGYLRSNGDGWLLLSPEGRARNIPDVFRPTLVATDWLTYRWLGLDPRGHHGLSIALHVACCLLLHRLLRAWNAPVQLRLAAVALFGVLALHAEPVAVISFREDLLAACFGLGALCLADDASRPDRGASRFLVLGLAVVASTIACGAKLSAAPIPAVLWLAHAINPFETPPDERPTRGRSLLAGAALALGVGLALAQRYAVLGGLSPYGSENPHVLAEQIGTASVLAASVKVHLGYLAQMLVPMGLSPEYTEAGATWSEPGVLLGALGLLAITGYAVWGAITGQRRVLAFAVLAATALMLPTANLVALSNLRADRFVYLSSFPICIGLGWAALELGNRLARFLAHDAGAVPVDSPPKPDLSIALAPLILVLVVQGASGMAAARSYASNTTLWKVAVSRAPGSARAQAMLGLITLGQSQATAFGDPGQRAQARAHCENALRLDPAHELPQICFARLAVAEKRWDDAYARYLDALERSPGQHDRLLAAIIELSVDVEAARAPGVDAPARVGSRPPPVDRTWAHAKAALREYPYSPLVHGAVGRAMHRTGYPHAARHYYDRARALYPERWQTAAWEVELALDTGAAVPTDALRRPHRRRFPGSFRAVDVVQRDALEARMAMRRRRFLPPLMQANLDLLVQSQAASGADSP